jgi:hypothetical protein
VALLKVKRHPGGSAKFAGVCMLAPSPNCLQKRPFAEAKRGSNRWSGRWCGFWCSPGLRSGGAGFQTRANAWHINSRALALVPASEAVSDFSRSLFSPCGTSFLPSPEFFRTRKRRGSTQVVYTRLQLLVDKGYLRVLDSSADDVTGYFAANGCSIESAPKQRK